MFLSGKAYKGIRARLVRSTCDTPRPEPHAANRRSIENLPRLYKHGPSPVGGATGLPYARHSVNGKDAIGNIHCFGQTLIYLHTAAGVRSTAISTETQVVAEIPYVMSVAETGSALADVSDSRAYCHAYG